MIFFFSIARANFEVEKKRALHKVILSLTINGPIWLHTTIKSPNHDAHFFFKKKKRRIPNIF